MIVNLTGHLVRIKLPDGEYREIPSHGNIRLAQNTIELEPIEGLPVSTTSFGSGLKLPAMKAGTIYLVSRLVCEAYPDRPDLYLPLGKAKADSRTIFCLSLCPNPYYHE